MKQLPIKKSLSEVGNRLRELRIKNGFTRPEAFADRYDIPRVQYIRMESGAASFTLTALLRVLAIYEMSLEDFFCNDPKKIAA